MPVLSAKTSTASAAVASSAPGRSAGAGESSRRSGSARGASAAVTRQTGTLTRKTQRQPSNPLSTPPSTQPLAPPPAAAAVHQASARARAAPSGRMSVSSASALGATSAAPDPLQRAAPEEGGAGRGGPAARGGDGEEEQAGDEHAAAAGAVGEAARGEEAAAEGERVGGDHPGDAGGAEAELLLHGRERDRDDRRVEHDHELGDAEDRERHAFRRPRSLLPSNSCMEVTRWTAATMRLDGGHAALELVNTIYGQVGQPPEHDVLVAPEDLVVLARRTGLLADAVASARAVRAARALRDALDPVLRGGGSLAPVERAAARAVAAGHLVAGAGWTWAADDPMAPVHAFALAAVALLSDAGELARLRTCSGCCWLFLDHSRGGSRRWCSMADCGTEAKKRRYVAARRERNLKGV